MGIERESEGEKLKEKVSWILNQIKRERGGKKRGEKKERGN